MEKSFNSLAELRAEIDLLKVKQFRNEEALKEKLSSPSAIFSTITSLFKSDNSNKSVVQDFAQSDIITNISRIILPIFLNGVLFKKSGFITKTLITFLSQKAAKQVNSTKISGILDKFKGAFKSTGRPQRTPVVRDYGIPPDSETY